MVTGVQTCALPIFILNPLKIHLSQEKALWMYIRNLHHVPFIVYFMGRKDIRMGIHKRPKGN
jgi:hypothetical protein